MRSGAISGTVALIASVTIAIAGVVVAPGSAWARSLGANAGQSMDNNTPRTCFSEQQGGIRWLGGAGCPTFARWQVMLPVDAAGSYTVTVRISRDTGTSQRPFCQVFAQTQDGVLSSQSNSQQLPVSPTGQFITLTLSGAIVPSAGYMFLFCSNFGPGDVMAGIDY